MSREGLEDMTQNGTAVLGRMTSSSGRVESARPGHDVKNSLADWDERIAMLSYRQLCELESRVSDAISVQMVETCIGIDAEAVSLVLDTGLCLDLVIQSITYAVAVARKERAARQAALGKTGKEVG